MIDWAFFTPVKLEKIAILLDKGYEVSIYFILHFGLSFLYRLFMFLANIFVIFEPLSNLLWLFAKRFLTECAEITALFN